MAPKFSGIEGRNTEKKKSISLPVHNSKDAHYHGLFMWTTLLKFCKYFQHCTQKTFGLQRQQLPDAQSSSQITYHETTLFLSSSMMVRSAFCVLSNSLRLVEVCCIAQESGCSEFTAILTQPVAHIKAFIKSFTVKSPFICVFMSQTVVALLINC